MANEWYEDPNHAVVECISRFCFYHVQPLAGVVAHFVFISMGCTHG